jgi:enediyne biosynthesis protein E4
MSRRIISTVCRLLLCFIVAPLSALAVSFSQQNAAIFGTAPNYDSRSASLGDYDNDGDLDLLFLGGTQTPGRLWRNNFVGSGVLTMTNVTSTLLPLGYNNAASGANGISSAWSAAWGDYDSDGRVDFFVGSTNTGTVTSGAASGDVFRNTTTGFVNTSAATGLADIGFHQNVAWADIDQDRDLDLLIAMEGPTEKHEIYLQGAGNTFTKVGAAAGFQVEVGIKAYGMAVGDTDGDGDLDVFISTCRVDNNIRNNFFRNNLAETGSLTFTDIADTNGTQNFRNTYNAEFHDFNNDGRLDLFVVGADGEASKIYRNNGNNDFTDVDTITGQALITDTGGDLNGGRVIDYDNDGDLDLFFHDHLPDNGKDVARKLYRNDGNWNFTDVTASVGLNEVNQGAYDSTWGDLDRDGDLDLVAPTDSNWNERIFLSDASANGNHWLHVVLNGPTGNTTGIGAELTAKINAGTPQELNLRREANTNAGTFNQSDLPVHFGLGAATVIDELTIRWRDGRIQKLTNVATNQYLTVNYTPGVAGDYNQDGVVNAADYTLYRDRVGSGVALATDSTAGVAGDDYARWLANFGASAPSESSAVPEPGTLILALASVLFLARSLATTR